MCTKKIIAEYENKIKRIIITESEIREAVQKAGKYIDNLYDGNPILLVSILKGAFVFMADLCRNITVPCEVGFMCAKSYYNGTVSTGAVKIVMNKRKEPESATFRRCPKLYVYTARVRSFIV